jgi:hypothetical protein
MVIENVFKLVLFGMAAKQWKDNNPELKGNIRDYANVSQLVCLSNMESLNAVLIGEGTDHHICLHYEEYWLIKATA